MGFFSLVLDPPSFFVFVGFASTSKLLHRHDLLLNSPNFVVLVV